MEAAQVQPEFDNSSQAQHSAFSAAALLSSCCRAASAASLVEQQSKQEIHAQPGVTYQQPTNTQQELVLQVQYRGARCTNKQLTLVE
jgi:hypothetical protein